MALAATDGWLEVPLSRPAARVQPTLDIELDAEQGTLALVLESLERSAATQRRELARLGAALARVEASRAADG